jgi:hypothetical protein
MPSACRTGGDLPRRASLSPSRRTSGSRRQLQPRRSGFPWKFDRFLQPNPAPRASWTISRDRHLRNLTVAQEADDLILRLRTADTDLNGLFAGQPFARLKHVFRGAE